MNLEKITRDQFVTYINTTPEQVSENYELLGVGITSYGVSFNPQTTTEKWIINRNATTTLDSYQKQGSVSQKCYKGDPVFEFVNKLRLTTAIGSKVETTLLDIDRYDEKDDGQYKAIKSNVMIAITNYMNEDAVIEYDIYYNGDSEVGTVTFADQKPTFVVDA